MRIPCNFYHVGAYLFRVHLQIVFVIFFSILHILEVLISLDTFGEKDPSYAAFHDEEWGVPVHDDKCVFH